MAAITQIKVTIFTGDRNNAGTDGYVYLGICGREFKLSRAGIDDFVRATNVEFRLGTSSNVEQPTFNDPSKPQLDTTDADRYPTYIRFEPTGDSPDWDFDGANVTITPGSQKYGRFQPGQGAHLWLGQNMGKFCYLSRL
jgi:hypothetical protein